MKKIRKKIALICLLCFSFLLTGCKIGNKEVIVSNTLNNRQVFRIGNVSCGLKEAKVYLVNYQNIYGTAGMAPLMIIGSVPLYNIMAVVVLSVFKPGNNSFDKALVKKTLKGIATNPIIIGIVAGFVWSALKLPMPTILHKVVSNVGATATPMGLMSMGATFEMKKATSKMKPTLVAVFMKLVGFCAIFLPMAALLGFRNEEMIAILVMLGSATTVSCFVMARNMGHEGTLSSGVIMMTTLLSAFTLTMWLDVLRSFGLV